MCQSLAKIILVIFNLIFLLAGSLMLAFGIVAMVRQDYIYFLLSNIPGIEKVPNTFDLGGIISAAAIFMIILGAIVAAVGFFGCCGACCENKALLIAYLVVLVLVLCAEVALIIFAAVAPEKLKGTIQGVMEKSMNQFREDVKIENGLLKTPNNTVSLGWTVLQFGANCCGTYNYTDYSTWPHNVSINGEIHVAQVPVSCCAKPKPISLDSSSTAYDNTTFYNLDECLNGNYAYINQKNCYDSIFDLIMKSSTIAIGIAAGIIGVQLILILFAVVLCNQTNKE